MDVSGCVGDQVTDNLLLKPDILEGAVSSAVHAFGLVLANDGVHQGSALVEVEDGVFPVSLGLTTAGAAATVESLSLAVVPIDWTLATIRTAT